MRGLIAAWVLNFNQNVLVNLCKIHLIAQNKFLHAGEKIELSSYHRYYFLRDYVV